MSEEDEKELIDIFYKDNEFKIKDKMETTILFGGKSYHVVFSNKAGITNEWYVSANAICQVIFEEDKQLKEIIYQTDQKIIKKVTKMIASKNIIY